MIRVEDFFFNSSKLPAKHCPAYSPEMCRLPNHFNSPFYHSGITSDSELGIKLVKYFLFTERASAGGYVFGWLSRLSKMRYQRFYEFNYEPIFF